MRFIPFSHDNSAGDANLSRLGIRSFVYPKTPFSRFDALLYVFLSRIMLPSLYNSLSLSVYFSFSLSISIFLYFYLFSFSFSLSSFSFLLLYLTIAISLISLPNCLQVLSHSFDIFFLSFELPLCLISRLSEPPGNGKIYAERSHIPTSPISLFPRFLSPIFLSYSLIFIFLSLSSILYLSQFLSFSPPLLLSLSNLLFLTPAFLQY